MIVTSFWNNKGGTGKTSLAFQATCQFAHENPTAKILALDICPQANFSELLLGGLEGDGSENLLKVQGLSPRATIGGYFQFRLPQPYSPAKINPKDFIIQPAYQNSDIPDNISLVAGDPLLELQSNAMSTLANANVPGTDTWAGVVSWLRNFLDEIEEEYDYVFIDLNPSFSLYTQIALAASSRIVLPVMADDSSRRAIQNAFSLLYGLRLPSPIYSQHLFSTRMTEAGISIPQAHLVVKNRITQYMGAASGYRTVLDAIDNDLQDILNNQSHILGFSQVQNGVAEVRDFQTTGVVAFALGKPFFALQPGKRSIKGRRVAVDKQQIDDRRNEISRIAKLLT
jgi:cellulose biosynthesis protein BcsQ